MLKSIKNIIILVVILSVIVSIPYLAIEKTTIYIKNLYKDTTIMVNDNGKIEITDKITFIPNKNGRMIVKIPLCLETENKYIKPQNLIVKLDNQLLRVNYSLKNSEIIIRNIDAIKGKKYEANITYEYNAKNVVYEYNNISVLKLLAGEYVNKSNIKIQLPEKTDKFQLESIAQTDYLGSNTYNISGKITKPYKELLIDKGVISNAKIIGKDYKISNSNDFLVVEENLIIVILLILTLISFIITIVLTKKVKIKKEYVRNPEEVIEPILAEAIIDRKIGAKELIMSCIVELIYRGNIKNIGNDKIQLLNYEKITEYEMEIIELIFKEKNQIVSFEEIKSIFLNDNNKTRTFFNKFKIIKKKIESKLFNYNIYSKVGEKILKNLRYICLDMLSISVYVFWTSVIKEETVMIGLMITLIIINKIISIILEEITFGNTKLVRKLLVIGSLGIFILVIQTISITNIGIVYVEHIYNHLRLTLLLSITIILNIIILIKSRTHVYTKTGKNEFAKAHGLKQYILDYSLMKERELDSVIIWDEYLAYAIAFGITNKITDKLNENLMNANIMLQKIESLLILE